MVRALRTHSGWAAGEPSDWAQLTWKEHCLGLTWLWSREEMTFRGSPKPFLGVPCPAPWLQACPADGSPSPQHGMLWTGPPMPSREEPGSSSIWGTRGAPSCCSERWWPCRCRLSPILTAVPLQTVAAQPFTSLERAALSPEKEHCCHHSRVKLRAKLFPGQVSTAGTGCPCSGARRRRFSAGVLWDPANGSLKMKHLGFCLCDFKGFYNSSGQIAAREMLNISVRSACEWQICRAVLP